MSETAVLEAKNEQREHAKKVKRATFDQMKNKIRAEDDFSTMINGEEASFLFRAIGGKAYDKLVNDCPAGIEDLAANRPYDEAKFAPLLLSKVCVEPEMTVEQWDEIWKSQAWNRGELGTLYNRAIMLCMKGLDAGPTAAG